MNTPITLSDQIERVWDAFSRQAPKRFERYIDSATGSHLDAIARYHWNIRLAEALTPALHATEVCLRNAIHSAMVQTHPSKEEMWFELLVPQGKHVEPLLEAIDLDHLQQAKDRLVKSGKPVEAPRLVCQLTFGFWVELLNDKYDKKIVRPLLAGPMRRVQDPYRKQAPLREIYGKFRDLRNRVAHLEPIFDSKEDLRHLYSLMLKFNSEIQPQYTSLVGHGDRFEQVWSAGWKPFRTTLLEAIRVEHERKNRSALS